MKNKLLILFGLATILTGCKSTPFYQEPAIVDISDSKVVVQWVSSDLPGNVFANKNTATLEDVKRVADQGCKQFSNKKAVLLSNTCGASVYNELAGRVCTAQNYLFACADEN